MEEKEIIVVNENDEIIGYKKRSDILLKDIHRVSALWIYNKKNEFLLAQRAFSKSNAPGIWTTAVAGTLEKGETYESNIYKEAEEELGIKGYKFTKSHKLRKSSRHNFFVQFYVLLADIDIDKLIIQKSEVEQIKWYNISEIHKIYNSPQGKFYSKSIPPYFELFQNNQK